MWKEVGGGRDEKSVACAGVQQSDVERTKKICAEKKLIPKTKIEVIKNEMFEMPNGRKLPNRVEEKSEVEVVGLEMIMIWKFPPFYMQVLELRQLHVKELRE